MCQCLFCAYDSESELDSSRACFAFHFLYLSIRSIRNDVFLAYRVINLCFKSSLAVGLCQRQYRHYLLIIHDYIHQRWAALAPKSHSRVKAVHHCYTCRNPKTILQSYSNPAWQATALSLATTLIRDT